MHAQEIMLYGSLGCSGCRWSRKYLDDNGVAYRWVDVNRDPEGLRRVRELNGGMRIVPTIVLQDGAVLVEPSNAELGRRLSIEGEPQGLRRVLSALSRRWPLPRREPAGR